MAAIVVKGVRPTKQANTPPPFYLTHTTGALPSYCHTCGRLVGSRKIKNAKTSATPSRYCSDKCKAHRPPTSSLESLDRAIEDVLFLLLEDKALDQVVGALPGYVRSHHHVTDPGRAGEQEADGGRHSADLLRLDDTRRRSARKGDHRVLVPCSLVETVVFGRESNVSRGQGRRRRAKEAKDGNGATGDGYDEAKLLATLGRLQGKVEESESEEDSGSDDGSDQEAGVGIDAVQSGFGGDELVAKRKEGQKRAEQRERVRNACRRAVIFGLREPGSTGTTDPDDSKGHKKGLSTGSAGKDMSGWSSEEDGRKGKKGKKGSKVNGNGQNEKKSDGFAVIDGERRKLCEAIMKGEVVEPSFAKGEWGVRWREVL